MCLTIIEILFLIAGLWLLISGKVPGKLFHIMFGKGEYELTPLYTRLFGLLLLSPIPVVVLAGTVIGMLDIENGLGIATGIEIGYVILVVIVALFIARKCRKPKLPTSTQPPASLNQ